MLYSRSSNSFSGYFADDSAKSLLASNGIALALGLILRWDLYYLMCVYWFQSVIIGYYNFRRMRALRNFSTSGLTMNERPVPGNEEGKRSTANFFALHYGFFHLSYLIFLLQKAAGFGRADYFAIAAAAFAFQRNHSFSFSCHLEKDLQRKANLGSMMLFPYLRVVPMHLMIGLGTELGASSAAGIILFAGLKTGADLLMHAVEHAWTGGK
ncbi:MAG: hypothetical protein COX65_08610 [Elusimicrobia bacterium CG_4_10_14_0_2_um_filter_56_8]|nr:MAG: hypothetical protein COX65_08610 [Elusimicrobia bacterium CG_4_10_14_0_2_um_filter_56_8]